MMLPCALHILKRHSARCDPFKLPRTAQRAMTLITAGGLVCSIEPLFTSPRDKADVTTELIKPDGVAQGPGPGAADRRSDRR